MVFTRANLHGLCIVIEGLESFRFQLDANRLILPPTSEIMNQKVADACIEAYLKEPVLQIVKDTDVRMLDYLRQENLQSEKLYLNSDCLNAEGQKIFMEQLMKDIWNA